MLSLQHDQLVLFLYQQAAVHAIKLPAWVAHSHLTCTCLANPLGPIKWSSQCVFLVTCCALQQFDPHVVIQPMSNGTCVKLFETHSRVFRNLTSKPRGNTQVGPLLIDPRYSRRRHSVLTRALCWVSLGWGEACAASHAQPTSVALASGGCTPAEREDCRSCRSTVCTTSRRHSMR